MKNNLKKEEILQNPDVAVSAMNFFMKKDTKKMDKSKKPRLVDFLEKEDPTKVFGKLTKIDEGCFGTVYKARHLKTGQMVYFFKYFILIKNSVR